MFALAGFKSGAWPLTSTVLFVCATFKVKLTVCFWPKPEITLSILLHFEAFGFTSQNRRLAEVAGN